MKDYIADVCCTLQHIKSTDSSKEKVQYLKDHRNDLVDLIFDLAYNKVDHVYGVTYDSVMKAQESDKVDIDLISCLAWINEHLGRDVPTNQAKVVLKTFITSLPKDESDIIKGIISHDLRLKMNVTQINKALGGLIPAMQYMRCSLFNNKTVKKIKFPALLQVKMDGTYREVNVLDDKSVVIRSRQGKYCPNSVLENIFCNADAGRYIGELTIENMSRQESNGLINSQNPPEKDITFTMWDYVSKDNAKKPYKVRWSELCNSPVVRVSPLVKVVHSVEITSVKEALDYVHDWMEQGEEGGVLKDYSAKYKNGTSDKQLKMKLKVDADVRVTGFTEGANGTAREGKVGAIKFATDDGLLVGQTSGFTDDVLDNLTDSDVGKIMTVQFSGLFEKNNMYTLMHPRFIEFRDDKTETDTVTRIKEMVSMMNVL